MSNTVSAWRGLMVGLVVASVLLLTPGVPQAADPLSIDVQCQTSIPASGGPLTINLTLKNRSSSDRTVARSAVAVHLANLNLVGPFIVPLNATLAPGQSTQISPYVSTTLPGGLVGAGVLVSLGVVALDNANKSLGTGFCLIRTI